MATRRREFVHTASVRGPIEGTEWGRWPRGVEGGGASWALTLPIWGAGLSRRQGRARLPPIRAGAVPERPCLEGLPQEGAGRLGAQVPVPRAPRRSGRNMRSAVGVIVGWLVRLLRVVGQHHRQRPMLNGLGPCGSTGAIRLAAALGRGGRASSSPAAGIAGAEPCAYPASDRRAGPRLRGGLRDPAAGAWGSTCNRRGPGVVRPRAGCGSAGPRRPAAPGMGAGGAERQRHPRRAARDRGGLPLWPQYADSSRGRFPWRFTKASVRDGLGEGAWFTGARAQGYAQDADGVTFAPVSARMGAHLRRRAARS